MEAIATKWGYKDCEESGSRGICQNPELASSFEKTSHQPAALGSGRQQGNGCLSLQTLSFSLVRSTHLRLCTGGVSAGCPIALHILTGITVTSAPISMLKVTGFPSMVSVTAHGSPLLGGHFTAPRKAPLESESLLGCSPESESLLG